MPEWDKAMLALNAIFYGISIDEFLMISHVERGVGHS